MSDPQPTTGSGTIRCNQCGNEVPRMEFCIICGDPLSDEYTAEGRTHARRRYAAAPNETVATVALVSTLFPQLPRAQMHTFRIALVLGAALIVVLALLGFFPVALVTAAVLVPLLMVMYVYVIDIYEDEPLSTVGATMLWGAAAGVVYALLLRLLPGTTAFGGTDAGTTLFNAVLLPLLEGALMLAGPLFLLPMRRFNDVLDGATFGAASAVAFSGAHVLVQSAGFFASGLRPAGDALPWIVQLLSLGVLQPVIAAGAVGAVAAAVWLRYRSPVRDRAALGWLGVPAVAVVAGAVLLVAAAAARVLLTLIPATVVLVVLAGVALLWLRATLHLGLLQESREIPVGHAIACPNCGHQTPEHTFCGHCGVALRALPKSRRVRTQETPPTSSEAAE